MRNVALQQIVHVFALKARTFRNHQKTSMSRQLTLSSLLSAFALVSLALFARAGELSGVGEVHIADNGPLVQVLSTEG